MSKKLLMVSVFPFLLCSLVSAQKVKHLSGEVIFEDGTHPEQPVQVRMLCKGVSRREVLTHKGYFTFELDVHSLVGTTDASVSDSARNDCDSLGDRPLVSFDLNVCEVRAMLPGFQSDRVQLRHRRLVDNADMGTIILHRLEDVDGTTVSVTTLRAPKKATKAYQKAQRELRKKKANYSKAAKELDRAVKEFPEFAPGWHLLGTVRLALGDQTGARQAFEKAVTADPKYISPYLSLARLEFEQGRWEEVARLSKGVIERNPYMTYAYYLSTAANYALGKLNLAEESARRVLASKEAQTYPHTHFILGRILAEKGNIPSAVAELHRFLEAEPEGSLSEQSRQLLAVWERQGP